MTLFDQLHPEWQKALADYQPLVTKIDSRINKDDVTPAYESIFAAYQLPPSEIKVAIFGQDPYPTPGYAHGLAFSVAPETQPLPASLRNIFKELMPHYLVRFGLAESLNRMATQKTKHVIDEFEFIDGLPVDIELSDEVMMHFFYIASELITNLLKHSHPNTITMKIGLEDQNLLLNIQHDGITLTQDDYLRLSDNTENLGLENIRYRLNIIQAQIFFKREHKLGVICLSKQLD